MRALRLPAGLGLAVLVATLAWQLAGMIHSL